MPSEKWIPIAEFGHCGIDKQGESSAVHPRWQRLAAELEAFLARHRDKTVLLAFGDLEPRKGFDRLLRLAASFSDTVCVRVGRTKPGYTPTWEAVTAKEQLVLQDRILEIDTFIDDTRLVERVLSCADFVVLPYRDFYRTSGVFVEALWRRQPALVPDRGVMGYRVKKYGLGLTYDDARQENLEAAFVDFRNRLADFSPAVERYRDELSKETFHRKLEVLIPQ
ncbi:MAG: hypothetical protein HN919_02385 [Verrucomicrobia bacterium]|nr:hypothetical protein [Verrucomicrobiota bacterium]